MSYPDSLLRSIQIGSTTLPTRVALAPMTRCQATAERVPSDNMVQFYRDRARTGLTIAEATAISETANGYHNTPGIYTPEQIAGWKRVIDAVHQNGGAFAVQLWHAGPVSHSSFTGGVIPASPSGIKILKERVPGTQLAYEKPQQMTHADIRRVRDEFCQAARNAVQAGADFVEIHGANGYLLDQFLHHYGNRRDDQYGGSPENMCRFPLEVVDAVIDALGDSTRVAIRISPVTPKLQGALESRAEDQAVFEHLLKELSTRGLGYVHQSTDDETVESGYLDQPISAFIRSHYEGVFVANGNYSLERAAQLVADGTADMVAFGRRYLANPDLLEYIKQAKPDAELAPYGYELVANPPTLSPSKES